MLSWIQLLINWMHELAARELAEGSGSARWTNPRAMRVLLLVDELDRYLAGFERWVYGEEVLPLA